ncbi:peptidylprolyl isomerase [Amaricoccus sp.]|uniref:peptidylprolyl isomerase n=1 Tax=Amaricoccus sp. TaxID=1872485 RepID=UPI002616E503|nr:peptidylprolyl isomerase [Amaricoccus sp.]HRO12886.1 peptidylprolyl isomerase [Amaricoccus sp.]
MRSILAAGLMAGLALSSPALAQDAVQDATQDTPARDYDASTVLATVNGTAITLGNVIAMRDRLPPQYQNLPDDVLLSGLLDQLVNQQLLATAESASPESDPLQVKLAVENERRTVLAGIAATAAVADAVEDAKVQAAYDKLVADFEPQPEFNAAHILVDSEDKAKALKAEIDGGKDFAEVAKENSSDGSAASGGDLGWFGAGQMVPEFETAVTALEVGQVSDPVQSQFGWHVIKLNEKRETTPPTLEQARAQIENQLREAALEAKLEELRAGATIDKPETGLPAAAIRDSDLLN